MDEPLEVEKLIRSCYANPDRKKFPDFWVNTKYPPFGTISLFSDGQNDNPEFFMNEVMQEISDSYYAFNA